MAQVIEISKEDAATAMREAAFTDSEGRQIIHRMGSFTGADCDLAGCLADVERASRIGWVPHPVEHDLGIELDGRCWFYGVKRPGGWSS